MRTFPVRSYVSVSLLFCGIVFNHSSSAFAQQVAATPTNNQVNVLKTIDPTAFRESFRDRLSGGLKHHFPFRMVADSHGRILVTEPFLSLVQVLDTKDGKWSQIHGDRNHRLVFPTYVGVDSSDNIYLSDPVLSMVVVYQPDGRFLRSIGEDHLHVPFGLAIDQANGKLFVADHELDQIQVYSLQGQLLQVIANHGTGPGELAGPCDLELHHDTIIVLDNGNARFQMFDMQGASIGVWPFGNNRLPYAFTFDDVGNMFYVDLESRGIVISNGKDAPMASFGVQVPYGQPSDRGVVPSFMSVSVGQDGSILALRPGLSVDVLKLGINPSEEQHEETK